MARSEGSTLSFNDLGGAALRLTSGGRLAWEGPADRRPVGEARTRSFGAPLVEEGDILLRDQGAEGVLTEPLTARARPAGSRGVEVDPPGDARDVLFASLAAGD